MIKETILPNGLVIVTRKIPHIKSASLGIWVRAGGRYEKKSNSGISHFLEHVLFKGTKNRTYQQIKQEIEGKGGILNGFTAEECTCYLAKVPSKHLINTLDVLSDMVINPLLPEKEIKRERHVILEEIRMEKDKPFVYVHCLSDKLFWPNHPLGYSLLGEEKVINVINRETLKDYKKNMYSPDNILIAVSGNLSHKDIAAKAKNMWANIKLKKVNKYRPVSENQKKARTNLYHKITEQIHFCLGVRTIPREHPDKYTLSLLNIILGGNSSSRLFEEIREKRGLAYDVSSSLGKFSDTGAMIISAGVILSNILETLGVIIKELIKIKRQKISSDELNQAKEFIIGQLMIGLEDTEVDMIRLGGSRLVSGKIIPWEEIVSNIKKVTSADIKRLSNKIFINRNINLAAIGPMNSGLKKKIEAIMEDSL
jgi:predicted Zn-dependent peptidase